MKPMVLRACLIVAFVFSFATLSLAQDAIEPNFSKQLFPVVSGVNGGVGFINESGRLILPNRFTFDENSSLSYVLRQHRFSEGLALVANKYGNEYKYGFINQAGKIIIDYQFDDARSFSEGLAWVEKGSAPYYINSMGVQMIKLPSNLWAEASFSEGLARVTDNSKGEKGKSGFINKAGELIVKTQFDDAHSFSEGLAAVSLNGRWGFIDKQGTFVVQPKYQSVGDFSEGLAAVKLPNNRLGFINKSGEMVFSTRFRFTNTIGAFSVKRGLHLLCKIDYGFLVSNVRANPADAPRFSDGLYPVAARNGNWGFINTDGKVAIPAKFSSVGNYSEGLAKVRVGNKYGFVNKVGKYLNSLNYDYADDFSNGLALVVFKWRSSASGRSATGCESKENVIYGYINGKGERVFVDSHQYEEVYQPGGDVFVEKTMPPLAELTIESEPKGAKVYLVPMAIWAFQNIDDAALENNHRQPADTNFTFSVQQQVYKVILKYNGKKTTPRQINVTDQKKNVMSINLNNEN
jgi:hypothetical protein